MKGKMVTALVIVTVFVLLGFVGFRMLGEITANTDGVGYYARGVRGGSNANGGGDLLDASVYVTSWAGGGQSEKIIIAGHYYGSGVFSPAMPRYWYKVTLTVTNPAGILINGLPGTEYTSQNYNLPDGGIDTGHWIPAQYIELKITNPCSGKIHAELWGHIHYFTPLPKEADFLLAEDEGYLKSGIGSISVPTDVIEEGKQVAIRVTTGYSHTDAVSIPATDQGWYLSIYDPGGNSVYQTTIGDNKDGYMVSWTVPTNSYSPTGTNTFKVVLRNELINQDQAVFFVIGPGMSKMIPNKPEFKLISGTEPFIKGAAVTIQLSVAKNPLGTDPQGFRVWVAYQTTAGSTTYYITGWENKFVAASGTGTVWTGEVSFTIPEAGSAMVSASTVDATNLNSGIATYHLEIQTQPPGTDEPTGDWTGLILGIVVIILSIVVGAIILKYLPLPPWNIVIGAVIIVAGMAVGLLLMLPTFNSLTGG